MFQFSYNRRRLLHSDLSDTLIKVQEKVSKLESQKKAELIQIQEVESDLALKHDEYLAVEVGLLSF